MSEILFPVQLLVYCVVNVVALNTIVPVGAAGEFGAMFHAGHLLCGLLRLGLAQFSCEPVFVI